MDNLLNKISEDDKRKMSYYLSVYGDIKDENFVGIDKWLEPWSYAKRKMYKAIGNNIITSVPIRIEKDDETLRHQVAELLDSVPIIAEWYVALDRLKVLYTNIFCTEETTKDHTKWKQEKLDKAGLSLDDLAVLHSQLLNKDQYRGYAGDQIFYNDVVRSGEFPISIKMRLSCKKKMLQIQKGCKWMKGVTRLFEYLSDIPLFKNSEITKHLEEFRQRHSTVFTGNYIEADLQLSIHPFDFLTMSDNAEGWSSCMNWRDGGCYKLGTIEMMNSNNVICCYIKTKNDFDFNNDDEKEKDDSLIWNSKSWRCLCYVTKDIILVGKAYPYESKVLSLEILKILTSFVKKNFGWTYSFGPELYEDMKWITTGYGLNRARDYLKNDTYYNLQGKKNIIFETGVMYNDMLNDSRDFHNFWCVRNSVPHTKFISVSGKCNCISCGKQLLKMKEDYNIEYSYREDESHNDRFVSSEVPLCEECIEKTEQHCPNCKRRLGRYNETVPVKVRFPDGHIEEITYCKKCLEYRPYGNAILKYPAPIQCRIGREPLVDLTDMARSTCKPYPRISIIDLRVVKEKDEDDIYEELKKTIESPTYEFPYGIRWKLTTLYGCDGLLACRHCVDKWVQEGKMVLINNKSLKGEVYYIPEDSTLEEDFTRRYSDGYRIQNIDENFIVKGVQ